MQSRIASLALVALASAALAPRLHAQAGTAFTYQGRLEDSGVPATGTYDFEFRLYDVPSGSIPIAATTVGDVTVTNGLFTVRLDFGGSVFTGTPRYLEVNGDASKTTAGSWLANSDRRLKTDIEGLTDALGVVRRLRPVRFHYSEDFRKKHPSVKDVYYHNYVAQEFQQVFADSVQDDGEGYLQMDGHPANVYAVAAIQELDRLLTEKDMKIAALERRLALLEDAFAKRIAGMEKTLPGGNGGSVGAPARVASEAEGAGSAR